MSNLNFKTVDRILSIVLAFIMTVSLLPMTAFASTEANPDEFTVTVRDESNDPIDGASISYEILVDSESKTKGNLSVTNGEAVIPNVSDYSDDIADESKTVEISYEITKDGYNTVNKKVTITDAAGSITETLTAVVAEKVNVTVAKDGNGTVYVNNEEITPQGCAIDKDSEVLIKVIPDEGSYIKEVQFGDNNIEKITDPQYFEKTITADEDISVYVTFVKTFTVEVEKNDGGTVTLNDEAVEENVVSKTYDENSEVKISVKPDDGYQIDSVTIGDEEQTVSDVTSFSEIITVTKNIKVAVSFVKVYVITVSYDANGKVVTDPECIGGSVTVKTGTIVSVKAIPDENYRVLNVVINDQKVIETTDNTYDNNNPYTKDLDVNQNYTIKITFALKLCNINVNVPEHGSVSVESNSVNYGDDATVTIIPDSGYVVKTVTVGDADLTKKLDTKDESKLELKLDNITTDKDIKIEFKESEAATIDSISWNNDDALRISPDENLYVFAKDSSVTFSTSKEAIRINGISRGEEWRTSEWSINEYTEITKIELYYDLGWHEVMVDGKSVQYNIDFDKVAPELDITPSNANKDGYYNTDVPVTITAVDNGNYSGIKTVDYWIEKDGIKTQEDNLFTFNISKPTQKQLVNKWTGSITVDTALNNSCNTVVYVKTVDNAGNENTESVPLDIDITEPTIKITYDDTANSNAKEGYFTSRKATVLITERTHHFDSEAATKGIVITAVDANGKAISNAYTISDWKTSEGKTPDDATHTATIRFEKDANYTFAIGYTDKADNKNTTPDVTGQTTPYNFTVDGTLPKGTVTVENNTWDKLLDVLTFGLYKNSTAEISATAEDDTSPFAIDYYKTSNTTAMTEKELDNVTNWTAFEGSDLEQKGISPNEQFVIYLRIMDYAGNYIYISSDGYVVEKEESKIELTPENPNENGIYGLEYEKGIKVDIEVTDSAPHSGIKTIYYWIEKDGIKTQEDNLFSFDYVRDSGLNSNGGKLTITDSSTGEKKFEEFSGTVPSQKQLVDKWTGSITVDTTLNNSCNTVVYVKTVDNAGNVNTKSVPLDIDITEPTIKITYDDTANSNAKEGYFTSRKATVFITERTHHFDSEAATKGIVITAVDANGKAISNAYTISDWKTSEGKIPDVATHTATIQFEKDANYTFAISYTDKADNKNTTPDVTGQTTPYNFTVDKTLPTGTVTVENNTWDKLLNVLTFGLYKNSTAKISATAKDDTSPFAIDYYKTSKTTAMTEKELDNVTNWTAFEGSDLEQKGISPNEQFVIYLRITDYAGNYTYISSDGYVVEKEESKIELTPEKPNENGIYGLEYEKGINVDIEVTDTAPHSGIKTIDYWIEKDGEKTQEDNLFSFDYVRDSGLNSNGGKLTITDSSTGEKKVEEFSGTVPSQEQLVDKWTGSITVDTTLNNSCNTVVYVKTVDNAGNENTKSVPLDIDITEPTIKITYDDTANSNAKEGYFTSRKATVLITERTHHFDSEAATKGIVITAVDANGKAISNAYTISDWKTSEGKTPDDATHTATIRFEKDANYTFAIGYTDKADNKNTTPDVTGQTTPYDFTVDTTKPTGTVTAISSEGRKESWSSLVDSLTFGFWSNKKISVSGISNDVTSPIASVQYYMLVAKSASDETTALNVAALDKIDLWESFNGFDVTSNKQFTVYLKITDNAGNYTYVGTNGLIVDDRHPVVESVAPEITVTPEKPVNGIYKDDVKVSIKVDDPMVSGTYSGLKNIAYKVFDRASASPNTPTQEGTLYTFDKSNPKQSELLKTWTGSITVESAKNNSNNIQIVVYAVDNAGNAGDNSQKNSSGYTVIKIDTTAPVIDISYNNNNTDSNTYFKENRVATIKITERNFNAEDVKINVTKYGVEVNNSLDWNDVSGSYNLDDSTHTATITYSADGDYTFAIEYTDLAGNKCTSINFAEGTVAGSKFTIDKTLPVIDVSYDNNSAQNGNYYKDNRTATIVITEHNFNAERVDVTMTATDDGAETTVPRLNGWTSNGDTHTATINYTNDAKYTFDIAFKDMAGNDAADFENQTFFIDKTVPSLEITGVADKSANKGNVAPVITYSDTNYDDNQVTITLDGANRKSVEPSGIYSDIHNGKVFTFFNFTKEKDIDDIYTLSATLMDKAGNSSTKSIVFSVNRFGSTYELSDETSALNGSYAKSPFDIVLTEINADKLNNIKITLFKNDKTIVLKEETDYRIDITGGNGQWYQYKYTIFKENFKDDGIYRLLIHSEDAAGNIAENALDTKDKELSFGIDKTPPTINPENLESRKTYAVENITAQVSVNDNLKLVSAVVYLDGEEYRNWKGEDLEKIIADGENFTFEISGDSTSAHNVKIIATDAAGNDNVEEISDFYVTTNILVRYFNNKPLFFGSLAGVIVIAGLIVFLVVFKRRKNEDKNTKNNNA